MQPRRGPTVAVEETSGPGDDTETAAAGASLVRDLVDQLGRRPLDRLLLARLANALAVEVWPAVAAYERLLAAPTTGQAGPEAGRP